MPAKGAIVYITVRTNSISSQELSSLVEGSGWWGTDLGGVRNSDYQRYFEPADTNTVNLASQGGADQQASDTCSVAEARIEAPAMVLGTEAAQREPEHIATGKPAFSMGSLDISPEEVNPGNPVLITTTVTSSSSQAGNYEVVLKINNEVEQTKTVDLSVGISEEVSFTASRDKPGSYLVEVNGLSGSFKVIREDTSLPPDKEPFNWLVVWGAIGVVVVIGLVILLFARRRSY
jgi:hypothetical protein